MLFRLLQDFQHHLEGAERAELLVEDLLAGIDVRVEELAAAPRENYFALGRVEEIEHLRGLDDREGVTEIAVGEAIETEDVGRPATVADDLHQAEDLAGIDRGERF